MVPSGYIDDREDPPDLARRIELLAGGRRTPLADAGAKADRAAKRGRQNDEEKVCWAMRQPTVMTSTLGIEPRLVEEARRRVRVEQAAFLEEIAATGRDPDAAIREGGGIEVGRR